MKQVTYYIYMRPGAILSPITLHTLVSVCVVHDVETKYKGID